MDLAGFRTAVERKTGVAYDPAAENELINEALADFSVEDDWPWLEAVTVITTDDGEEYTLPAGWRRVRAVTFITEDVNGNVTSVDELERLSVRVFDADLTQSGWAVRADKLVVSPRVSDRLLRVVYQRTEPVLTADADLPLLPQEHHQAVVDLAAALVLERSGELVRSKARMDAYERKLARIRRNKDRAGGPVRVRNAAGWEQ